jgi:hypothetical protein
MTCLETTYYYSQIILTVIAAAAASSALYQLKAANLSDLLNRLEAHNVREARRLIYTARLERSNEPWWRDGNLSECANDLCATFDILWITAKWGNRRFFAKYWAYTICWTYEALDGFLKERRRQGDPAAFDGYRRLYELAKPFDPRKPPPTPGPAPTRPLSG